MRRVDRRPVSLVFVFVLRSLLQDEPKLPPDEKGLDARALGGPVLGVGGAQEEQGRTMQVCLSSSPNTHSTYVFIYPFVSVTMNRCAPGAPESCRCSGTADPGADR